MAWPWALGVPKPSEPETLEGRKVCSSCLSVCGHRLVVMAGQRLSQRLGKVEPDGPYEGVPEHLVHGIVYWFDGVVGRLSGRIDERRIRELAVFLRTKVHPGWGAFVLAQNLLNDAQANDDEFLDLIDGAL